MNQPTMEQFNQLQRQYYELSAKVERLDEMEKKRDFTIRDSSVKIGIAQGLAESTHKKISQLELEINELRTEVKELRNDTDQQFETIHQKLDKQEAMTKENSQRITRIESDVNSIKSDVNSIKSDVNSIKETQEQILVFLQQRGRL